MTYNMMSCEGADWTRSILGGCSQAWFVLAIIFFIILVIRRQCADGLFSGVNFSFVGALGLGLGGSILLTTLTGEARWSFLAGLVGVGVGGFGLGLLTGAESGGGDYDA